MTDAEISAALARAIGYADDDISIWSPGFCVVWNGCNTPNWRPFNYTDWTIAGPVLDWLLFEHSVNPVMGKTDYLIYAVDMVVVLGEADTLPLAIAHAAIAVVRGS